MDEGLVNEEAPVVDAAEGAHLHNKESEYRSRPESSSMLESRQTVMAEGNAPASSFQILADMLEGKNVNRIINTMDPSDHPCSRPQNADDSDIMVEELTVQQHNSSSLPIVGTSNNRERRQSMCNRWQHHHKLRGGSGSGSSHDDKDNEQSKSNGGEDVGTASFHEILSQRPLNNEALVQHSNAENVRASANSLSNRSIRTKILSSSGFSEFFVKTTLKGKGIVCRGKPHGALKLGPRGLNDVKASVGTMVPLRGGGGPAMRSNVSPEAVCDNSIDSNPSLSLHKKIGVPSSNGTDQPRPSNSDCGVTLRAWLKSRCYQVKKVEGLYIFKQIVNLVDCSHSQGVTLLNLWPSYLKLFQSNQVKYIGSTGQKETLKCVRDQDIPDSENYLLRKQRGDQEMFPAGATSAKKQKFNKDTNSVGKGHLFSSESEVQAERVNESDINVASRRYLHSGTNEGHRIQGTSSNPLPSSTAHQQLTSVTEQLEEKWYASPEELSEGVCTITSNIYSLGVLFFELLGCFNSEKAHAAAMSDLRHRILPSTFLSENPKEAGFCLWLLHPEPLSRPTTRDILQSEVINGLQEVCAEELSSSIEQDDTESELLMNFLISLEEQKQDTLSKLTEDIKCLEADIEEVEKRNQSNIPLVQSTSLNNSKYARDRRYPSQQPSSLQANISPISEVNETRLMKNIGQLEKAYFSKRSKIQLSDTDAMVRSDLDLLRNRESLPSTQQDEDICSPADSVGSFFKGLCKYARYSKFEARGVLRTGDFNNSANVICSLSFDRDEDHFAAAGVSKKIKIFEFNSLLNDSVDIHYPAVEMSNRSKLSCVCWNSYIKNYLASADYDGVVKIWDANTGQAVSHYMEHEKRAWSADFSQVHPTKLASGSDDCSVKLWSINDKNCLGTIRNIANVCCVQFSSHSSHLLAFGSADYRTYCFDLRNAKAPWCVLAGHDKAVSYVKFVDSATLVTASTDNTLKLWDLKKTTHNGLSTNACSLTFGGHTNEKNFVGLSVSDGYIACGSESNEVYAYYKSLPMPITSHKFGSIDPISGKETDDDNGLFVSSVCWRGKSDTLIAANSSGCIKVLQMV